MIFILTGPVHSGKTTLLKKIVQELKRKRFKIEGFLSLAVVENKKTVGYDLFDVKGETSFPFIRQGGKKGWQAVGSFSFIPQSLTKAKNLIHKGIGSDVLVVDEIGPLELEGKGLRPALEHALRSHHKSCICVVRRSILEELLDWIGKREVKIFEIERDDVFLRMLEEIQKDT